MRNNYLYQDHIVCKRYGQHFLNDQLIIDAIVSAINPKKSQEIVEIGPGLAALTEPIGKYLDHLTVIELDYNLASRLKSHPRLSQKLTVYQEDATTVNFNILSEKAGKSLRIFGNLPYNISTSLMFHLFNHINVISDIHFTFQKEVANRLLAKPNSKTFSRLSVITQYYCQVIPILDIPPNAFIPIPKVDSKLVRLVPYKISPYPAAVDLEILDLITIKAFKNRRKKIRNSLSSIFTNKTLIEIGVDPEMRAENISVTEYCQMANYIGKSHQMERK